MAYIKYHYKKPEITLFEIPWQDVLFQYVFPGLSWKDIFNLRATSTLGKTIISEYMKSKQNFDYGPVCDKFNASVFKLTTKDAKSIRHLCLKNCKWLTNDHLRPILQRNPHLVSLDLGGCSAVTNASLQIAAVHCKRLQNISLKNCHWVSPAAVVSLAINCPSIEVMDLTSCWELTDEATSVLASHCSSLRSLSLSRIYGITDQTLGVLASYCQHLEDLDVSGCWRITDYGVRLIGEYCRQLKRLCVSDCRDVTESSLNSLRGRLVVDRSAVNYSLHSRSLPLSYSLRLQI